jgi:hypothetical protein
LGQLLQAQQCMQCGLVQPNRFDKNSDALHWPEVAISVQSDCIQLVTKVAATLSLKQNFDFCAGVLWLTRG